MGGICCDREGDLQTPPEHLPKGSPDSSTMQTGQFDTIK